MSIQRLNPPDVYPPFQGAYTQVIRSTGRVHVQVAGTVSLDVNRNLVGPGDMRTQVRTIMQNIGRSLAAVNAQPSDVVRINIFTLNVDEYLVNGHVEVMAFFGNTLPTSTLAGVTRLADPRYLVEIQCDALVQGGGDDDD